MPVAQFFSDNNLVYDVTRSLPPNDVTKDMLMNGLLSADNVRKSNPQAAARYDSNKKFSRQNVNQIFQDETNFVRNGSENRSHFVGRAIKNGTESTDTSFNRPTTQLWRQNGNGCCSTVKREDVLRTTNGPQHQESHVRQILRKAGSLNDETTSLTKRHGIGRNGVKRWSSLEVRNNDDHISDNLMTNFEAHSNGSATQKEETHVLTKVENVKVSFYLPDTDFAKSNDKPPSSPLGAKTTLNATDLKCAKTSFTGSNNALNVGSNETSDAKLLEEQHVHAVYDRTAHHFSEARYKAWPAVKAFLKGLPVGSMVADVGCGHGKYLRINKRIHVFGSDHSSPLVQIARSRAHSDVAVCDNLRLPYRSDYFDAVISVGVIHHFSSVERRVRALQELARVLCSGGRVMIYVWALEQHKRQFKSQDVLVPWHLKATHHKRVSKIRNKVLSTSSLSEDEESYLLSERDPAKNGFEYRCVSQLKSKHFNRHQSSPALMERTVTSNKEKRLESVSEQMKVSDINISQECLDVSSDLSSYKDNSDRTIDKTKGSTLLTFNKMPNIQSLKSSSQIDEKNLSAILNTSHLSSVFAEFHEVPFKCVQQPQSEYLVIERLHSTLDPLKPPSQNDLSPERNTCDKTLTRPVSVHKISKVEHKQESLSVLNDRKKSDLLTTEQKLQPLHTPISKTPTFPSLASVLKRKFTNLFFNSKSDVNNKKNDSEKNLYEERNFDLESPVGFAVREFPQSSQPLSLSQSRDFEISTNKVSSYIHSNNLSPEDEVFEPPHAESFQEYQVLENQLCVSEDVAFDMENDQASNQSSNQSNEAAQIESDIENWESTTNRIIQRMESQVSLKLQMSLNETDQDTGENSIKAMQDSNSLRIITKKSPNSSPRLRRSQRSNSQPCNAGVLRNSQRGVSNRFPGTLSQSSSVSSMSSEGLSESDVEDVLLGNLALMNNVGPDHNRTHDNSTINGKNPRESKIGTSLDGRNQNGSENLFRKDHLETHNGAQSTSEVENNGALQRYYHVFREGELDTLIRERVPCLRIVTSSYDHANWCVVAEKL